MKVLSPFLAAGFVAAFLVVGCTEDSLITSDNSGANSVSADDAVASKGGKAGAVLEHKYWVCHYPPGNEDNPLKIHVGEDMAVMHLENHAPEKSKKDKNHQMADRLIWIPGNPIAFQPDKRDPATLFADESCQPIDMKDCPCLFGEKIDGHADFNFTMNVTTAIPTGQTVDVTVNATGGYCDLTVDGAAPVRYPAEGSLNVTGCPTAAQAFVEFD